MEVIKMAISQIQRPERNIRIHSDKQLKEFERSIKQFGQIRPIVVDENNIILAGNGLYETLVRLGYTEADVYQITGLTDNQKKKLMMSDNKIFALGVDDLDTFNAFLEELQGDLDIPGYDEEILNSIMAEAEAITEMINEYGTISSEEIKAIEMAGERKQQLIAQYERKQSMEAIEAPQVMNHHEVLSALPNNSYHNAETESDISPVASVSPQIDTMSLTNVQPLAATASTTPVTRTIVCPKCGETICL